MRFVYLDESGIGNPGKEPWVVVGAVMVHANYQLKNVEKYLHDMADDYIKPQHRARFFFHAADLANGSGIFADRELYPHDLVRSLLRGICEIPKLFRLPAIVGHVNREEMRQNYPGLNRQELVVRAQVTASMVCSMAVERCHQRPSGLRGARSAPAT